MTRSARDLAIVLGGGGNRAFYQQGLLEAWGDMLWPRVGAVASVSGGAAIAVLILCGRLERTGQYWRALRRGVRRNIDPLQALMGSPIAPHGEIYRSALFYALCGGGFETLRTLPFPVYVLCARPPSGLPIALSIVAALGLSLLERTTRVGVPHATWAKAAGFSAFSMDLRSCHSPNEVVDLVLSSSAVPPFVPVGMFRKQRLLDGCIIDNAPAFLAEQGAVSRTLVLLTHHAHGHLRVRGSRLYVGPSERVPVAALDYTEGAPIEESVALGRRDAERYALQLQRWLADGPPGPNDVTECG